MVAAGETRSLPPGSVIITPEDMWRAIEEIRDTGRRTESAVTELKLVVNPALNNLRADVDEHDKRLNALEQQAWSSRWVPAIVTAILTTVIGGVALYLVTNGLKP